MVTTNCFFFSFLTSGNVRQDWIEIQLQVRLSFQHYIHTKGTSMKINFLFLSQLFFIFTSTQVKKWTGNVPFLHIIGLDRPQTTFNRYTIILLHPKKQDAEEDYTSFFTRIECIYYFVQPSPTLGTKTWTISERIHIIPFCR